MTDMACEVPLVRASDQEIIEALKAIKTIAVVGLSHRPEKDSFKVAAYLLQNGFEVIPVNPIREEILGRKCYKSLRDIPGPVDMADLFLSPDRVMPAVEDAIEKKVKVIWMQIGVINNDAAQKAMENGIKVFMNICVMREHNRLKPLFLG